jgi:hypothetical protein
MPLVETLAKALAADRECRPDHGCAWWHLTRDYPAVDAPFKTSARGDNMRQ